MVLERQRTSVLYNYGPGKVFDNDSTDLIEEIVRIEQESTTPMLRVNMDQLRARLKEEVSVYRLSDFDRDQISQIPISIVQPDYLRSRPYPLAYYCQVCGHLYYNPRSIRSSGGANWKSVLRGAVPPDLRCVCTEGPSRERGSPCGGPLVQYDVLTTHNCGAQVFVPETRGGQCKSHGGKHLHWYRQGSERASRWRIVCLVDGCGATRESYESFFARHYGCPLEGQVVWSDTCRPDFNSAPFMKATHYMEKVIHLLNSDNSLQDVVPGTRAATVAATGCLRDGASFGTFHDDAGYEAWSEEYSPDRDFAGGVDERLEDLQLRRQQIQEFLPAGASKDRTLAELDDKISRKSRAVGTGLNPGAVRSCTDKFDFARQIRDTTLYMDKSRGWPLSSLRTFATVDNEYVGRIDQALAWLPKLGIVDVRYQERIPITTALVGYTRGTYRPDEAKLNMFGSAHGIEVYASLTHTEGIWVQVDPTRTLAWLNRHANAPKPVNGSFPGDLLTLQTSFELTGGSAFGTFNDEWTSNHFGLLHTLSHLLIKAAGRLSGLEQEGIGEEILPYTNSFLIYSNHSGEFNLGGLQLLMEHHMDTILAGLKDDALRCVYNPVCEKTHSSCHGCLHISEVSCPHFNRTMARRLLIGPAGFWS
jgi:hypothetical protein